VYHDNCPKAKAKFLYAATDEGVIVKNGAVFEHPQTGLRVALSWSKCIEGPIVFLFFLFVGLPILEVFG